MKKIGLFFIFFCLLCSLKAQTDYRPGYILTLSGDTVYGRIDYRGDYTMGHICRFMSDAGIKTEYMPNEIQAYRFVDSKYYVSKIINEQAYFLEYLIKGEMNIYYLRDDTGDRYYVEREDIPLKEIPYTEELRSIDNKKYLYKSTTHIGLLNYLTKDVPKLQPFINKIKEPAHDNLTKVAKVYHEAVCKSGEKCIVFERPVTDKMQIEPSIGYYFLTRQLNNPDKIGFVPAFLFGGANIYIPSGINENWHIKTSVLYSHIESSNFFMFPIQLAYTYPKGRFRPTFAGGFGSMLVKYDSRVEFVAFFPSYSVGLLTRVNRKTSLSFNLGLDAAPISEVLRFVPNPKEIFGLMPSLGLRHTF